MNIFLGNCGERTLGVAIPVSGITLCGRVSSRPTGGAGEARVRLFLFLRLVGDALSTSALREGAERRRTRLNISTSAAASLILRTRGGSHREPPETLPTARKGDLQKVRVPQEARKGASWWSNWCWRAASSAPLPALWTPDGRVRGAVSLRRLVKLPHGLFTERRADPIVQGRPGSAAQMVPFYNRSVWAVSQRAAAASVPPTVPASARHVILAPLLSSCCSFFFVVEPWTHWCAPPLYFKVILKSSSWAQKKNCCSRD